MSISEPGRKSREKCDPDEVIQITKEGVSGNEYACKTTRSSRDKNGWNLRMSCDGEGYNWTLNLRWRLLKSGRLRETAKGKTVEYTRCTAVRWAAIAIDNGYAVRPFNAEGIHT